MPALQQKITPETEIFIAQSGLKNTTAINAVLANDNARVTALNTFVKKQKEFEKNNKVKQNNAPAKTAMISQSHSDVASAIQVIKDHDLDQDQAQKFLKDVEALSTLKTATTQDVSHYSTPALQQLREAITPAQDAPENAKNHELQYIKALDNKEVNSLAMGMAVDARRDMEMEEFHRDVALENELKTLSNLNEMAADERAMAYQNLDPRGQFAEDLYEALQTLGGDDEPPEMILENLMTDEPEEEALAQKKEQELAEKGTDLLITDGDNQITVTRGDDIHQMIDNEADTQKMAEDMVSSEKTNKEKQLEMFGNDLKRITNPVRVISAKHGHAYKPEYSS